MSTHNQINFLKEKIKSQKPVIGTWNTIGSPLVSEVLARAGFDFLIIDFENGVNVTLGLPIIRTSPDHGTALDIAGKGIASEKSLYASIKMSQNIAKKRKLWIQ